MGARTLIVDDDSGCRELARRLLDSEGYRVVAEAADCASALRAARELAPELALVDVYLPDGDGFDLATQLTALEDPPAVVLMSSRDGADFEALVPKTGARGFVPKAELSVEAIEELLE
ncbi:MAG: response regulator [Solirubrobacterales bacterium]